MIKRKKPKEIPYEDIGVVPKTIEWHATEICKLHDQLKPYKTPRGLVGAINQEGTTVLLIFKGSWEDVFRVKYFLEKDEGESST